MSHVRLARGDNTVSYLSAMIKGMHTILDAPFTAFDIESTGTDPLTDRIVTATVVTIDPARGTTSQQDWLVNPGCDIPEEAQQVHGITTEYAAEHGVDPAEVVPQIAALLDPSRPVVAYNAPFDLTMLREEMRRHGHAEPELPPVVDPLAIDRGINPHRQGRRRLVNVCASYDIDLPDDEAHGSAADALAAARLAWKLCRHPRLEGVDLPLLQTAQARWHHEWADGFEAWLNQRKEAEGEDPVTINRGWPIMAPAV